MASNHINKVLKTFLKQIFCVVGRNSPYDTATFLHILVTAALTGDFVNNTSVKTQPCPSGQTVFNRLLECTQERVEVAFNQIHEGMLKRVRSVLRSRKAVLAFDVTEEPFYGEVTANWLWIHEYKPARGSTGSFEFLTVSIVVGKKKFILGVLPVRRGWNKAEHIETLLQQARRYVRIETCLFDRGFTSYEVIHCLKQHKVGYQIFWKKNEEKETWLTKELKAMRPGELREYIKEDGHFDRHKTRQYVRTRFVIIKQYRYNEDEEAYDWVFATNLKLPSKMWYVRRYKCRWGIETSYRVTDEVRIRTTTLDIVKRYFLFAFSCLLYNLWKFVNLFLTVPVTFATFMYALFSILNETLQKEGEPPDPIKHLHAWLKEGFL